MTKQKRPTAKIETITPAKAKKLLAGMVKDQRGVRRTHVTQLAKIIKAGLWKLDGQTIKINTDGKMFDGQHRCLAVVETGIPIETFVVRGLEVDAFATVDSDLAVRRLRDKVSMQFPSLKKQASLIAQIYGKVLDYEGTTPTGYESMGHRNRGTWNYEKAFEWVESNQTHLVKIAKTITTKDARVICMPQAIFGAMYFLFRKTSVKEADAFFETLIEGLHFPKGKNDPIYWCRKEISALHAKRTTGVRPKRYTYYVALDYAWQAHMEGREITTASNLRVKKKVGYIKFNPTLKRRKKAA